MRCEARELFIAITPQGEVAVKPGQVVKISDEKLLIDLINERKITPLEGRPWLIYSEVLQDFLWAVRDERARQRLIAESVQEVIYTEAEIDLLQGASKETLKTVHEAKKLFQGSRIQEVNKKTRKEKV